ncbi:hypothetical protein LTS18_007672 [Coniosporium uncinatum]|uniref:Uncharacterized protein n=1 Tax=Coniosporium uncinatum TaxID=93489 RepID=A0ACC3DXR4_9PEZI|nr:hypothetical protein LTS18_007672 [Coniosporium uncinatum]
MPAAKEKEDLARIRDNQRRSRATRKAYLQELEAKYRKCEQHGIEASAEIQAAARKVLEENKRLRALLKRSGISDAEIDGFQHAQGESPGHHASPEMILDTMLSTRRPCSGLQPRPKSILQLDGKAPISPQVAEPSRALLPQPLPHARFTASSTTLPPSLPLALAAPAAHIAPNLPYAAGEQPEPEHNVHARNQHHHQTYHYQSVQPASDWVQQNNDQYDTNQPYSHDDDDPGSRNYSSCVHAANIIRSMRSDVGVELEADLGCKSIGQDCRVNNAVVFEVMDRYSGPSERT